MKKNLVTLLFCLSCLIAGCGKFAVYSDNPLANEDPVKLNEELGLDGVVLSYALPKGELPVTVKYSKNFRNVSASHPGISYVADLRMKQIVRYQHNEFANDEATVEIDPKTLLLKSVSTTTDDKTADIITKIASVIKEASNLNAAIQELKTQKFTAAKEEPTLARCKSDFQLDVRLPITYHTASMGGEDTDKAILTKSFESIFYEYATDKVGGAVCKIEVRFVVTRVSKNFAASLPIDTTGSEGARCPVTAVCFRSPAVYTVKIKGDMYVQLTDLNNEPQGSMRRLLPIDIDLGQIAAPAPEIGGVLHFRRRPFVANTTTATFADGMLQKIYLKDPSAVLGFLNVPIEILKSSVIIAKF